MELNNQISVWAKNLKYLRERRKLTQDQLSDLTGITRVVINSLEGGRTKTPTLEYLKVFSGFFKISIDSMINVDLSKLTMLQLKELEAGNDIYLTGSKLRVLAKAVSIDNKEQVEMVTIKAKAGYAAGYGDPDFIAQLPVFHMPNLPKDRKFRMFPIIGDSMLPVREGSYIIVEYMQDWTSVKNGTPCAVVTKEDGVVFKMVENRISESGTLLLISLNPTYKPYEVAVSEVLELWKYHSYWTDGPLEPAATGDVILRKIAEVQKEVKLLANKL